MELLDTRKRRAGLRPVRLFLECQHNTIRKHKDGAPWCSTSVNFGGGEGSRTPVRKPLAIAFFECSLSFGIPLTGRRWAGFRLR